ncbi:MAG: late competence development ComFB family protein [Gammaproteobacteria bacterium]|nr:late competence development ComFB family protein [Gammaproteobacteria bacterium]
MDFSSIHNYYEHLVERYLLDQVIPQHPDKDDEFFLDIACYALTKLPSRYMRHEIDMAFYMRAEERHKINKEVEKAVHDAVSYISENFERDKTQA